MSNIRCHALRFFFFFFFFVCSCTPLARGAAPLTEDNTAILNVLGRADVNEFSWSDSYSVGDSCYCATTFDHDIDVIVVDTVALGEMTIRQVCELLGPGPGSDNRPRYNDIQCGNGPANSAGDEDDCPGRTEYGQNGCKYIGPKWNFDPFTSAAPIIPMPVPVSPPRPAPTKRPVAPIPAPAKPVASTPEPTKKPVPPVPAPTNKPVSPIPAPTKPVAIILTPTKPVVPPTVPAPTTPSPTTPPAIAPLLEDFTRVRSNVTGDPNVVPYWVDSYSAGDECFCMSTLDGNIGSVVVDTPNNGPMTVKEVCDAIGPGPGSEGRPLYNDIQCGNGPASESYDETACPGRTEFGAPGCKFIGPKWNFGKVVVAGNTTTAPTSIMGTIIAQILLLVQRILDLLLFGRRSTSTADTDSI